MVHMYGAQGHRRSHKDGYTIKYYNSIYTATRMHLSNLLGWHDVLHSLIEFNNCPDLEREQREVLAEVDSTIWRKGAWEEGEQTMIP